MRNRLYLSAVLCTRAKTRVPAPVVLPPRVVEPLQNVPSPGAKPGPPISMSA
jgi:hypothetical protein